MLTLTPRISFAVSVRSIYLCILIRWIDYISYKWTIKLSLAKNLGSIIAFYLARHTKELNKYATNSDSFGSRYSCWRCWGWNEEDCVELQCNAVYDILVLGWCVIVLQFKREQTKGEHVICVLCAFLLLFPFIVAKYTMWSMVIIKIVSVLLLLYTCSMNI